MAGRDGRRGSANHRIVRILRAPGVPPRPARAPLAFLDEVLRTLGFPTAGARMPDVCRYAQGVAQVVDVSPSTECACLPLRSPPRYLKRAAVWRARRSWRAECMALGRADGGGGDGDVRAGESSAAVPKRGVGPRARGRAGGRAGGNAKNAICALFCRRTRLAHFGANVAGRAAWHETQAIQDAHGCSLHTAGAYLCRENVSKGISADGWTACGAQKAITEILAAVAAVVCKALPVPAVQSPAGDRKSGLSTPVGERRRAARCATFLVPCEMTILRALALPACVHPFPFFLPQIDPALPKRLAAHCRSAGVEPPRADGG
ncbi:hypothetical protein FB451DRAFT_1409539 [Mycena latifolia]|nr:hypothetical protein FB451DRAFT_1409539 [Mycena latifolia]